MHQTLHCVRLLPQDAGTGDTLHRVDAATAGCGNAGHVTSCVCCYRGTRGTQDTLCFYRTTRGRGIRYIVWVLLSRDAGNVGA
ncbi:hypothetical protein [Paenibacillus silvae]|uniref:hypothetical protein n=1 Tax=Paenibacillus silvae TaxID=1325358 RepID=UPI002004BA57|nr:hypothetical protein [Paenibacillus silvae]MCK6078422.1 hypothetical protein [Paenibacillus silvae]MCK6152656.1 hypothetical protein [Paenibacillus silvae]MCK6271167.1 hypothetical protein [Paenibacillus silvae]